MIVMQHDFDTIDGIASGARIIIVDDEPANLKLLDKMLRGCGYENLVLIDDPRRVIDAYGAARPDLILLDINMPHKDGFQILSELTALNDPMLPPVIMLTAQSGHESLMRALSGGARDFVSKPFERFELLARVRNLLDAHLTYRSTHRQNMLLEDMVKARTLELRESRLQIVQRLGRAAEYRDNETGAHVLRMSHVSALLARSTGWDESQCEMMLNASPMHDVGKIGIPDAILLKPGKISPEEREIMNTHAEIGADIIGSNGDRLLDMAREIALTHHEKWDGSGYPNGLAGKDIPLAGRITAIADVFDALTSSRPYKKAWPLHEAVTYMQENAGKHFDPHLITLFLSNLPEVEKILAKFREP